MLNLMASEKRGLLLRPWENKKFMAIYGNYHHLVSDCTDKMLN